MTGLMINVNMYGRVDNPNSSCLSHFLNKMLELQLLGPNVVFTPPSQSGSCFFCPPERDLIPGTYVSRMFLVFCVLCNGDT